MLYPRSWRSLSAADGSISHLNLQRPLHLGGRHEQDIAFTFEYSIRTAWEAIYRLLKRGPAPPRVYQGQLDPKGVWAALKEFLGLAA